MICADLADLCTINSDCEAGNDCINGFCVPITAPNDNVVTIHQTAYQQSSVILKQACAKIKTNRYYL